MAAVMMGNNKALAAQKKLKRPVPYPEVLVEDPKIVLAAKYNDFEQFANPLLKAYVRYTKYLWELAYGKWAGNFDAFIISVIIIAGAMVGIQTYPDYECPAPSKQDQEFKDSTGWREVGYCERRGSEWLGGDGIIDQFVFYVFVLEVAIKILAQGAGPWNYFVGPDWRWNVFDFSIVALSIKEIASLLFGGSGGGGNLMILRLFRLARLLKLVGKVKKLQMIVFGLVAGVKAAGYIAMLLFLVFYIFAIAGMLAFRRNDPFHFRSIPVSLLSLFRACTMEDWTDIMYINMYGCQKYNSGLYFYHEDYRHVEGAFDDHPFFNSWEELPNYLKCNHPTEQPALSAFYWIIFIFISTFVMLSLFIGAITIAMSEQMELLANEADPEDESKFLVHMRPLAKDISTSMKACWNKYATTANEPQVLSQGAVAGGGPSELKYRFGVLSRFAELNSLLAGNEAFQNFVTCTILCAGVTVGVDTELEGSASPYAERSLDVTLWYFDTVINWIFTVEVLVKLAAEDWHPWRYFYDGWNKFDFFIVFTSWIPCLLEVLGMGGGTSGLGALKLLRLLRLFRIMRVVKKFPELTVIVNALLVGMESIGFIALILFVVFYMFAIGGMMLFASNDEWHFGRLHRALLTLFRIATFEDWTDVMYINVYGCARWGYNDDGSQPNPHACTNTEYGQDAKVYAAFYFIIFVFLGSLVLLTLFVGVVTTSMEEAQATQRHVMEGEKDIEDYLEEYGLPSQLGTHVRNAYALLDINGDGEISLSEFTAAVKAMTELYPEDHPKHLLVKEKVEGEESEDDSDDDEEDDEIDLDGTAEGEEEGKSSSGGTKNPLKEPKKLKKPKKLVADLSDGTANEVPEKGNPFVVMKYILNYMAKCANSQARFTYLEEEEFGSEVDESSGVKVALRHTHSGHVDKNFDPYHHHRGGGAGHASPSPALKRKQLDRFANASSSSPASVAPASYASTTTTSTFSASPAPPTRSSSSSFGGGGGNTNQTAAKRNGKAMVKLVKNSPSSSSSSSSELSVDELVGVGSADSAGGFRSRTPSPKKLSSRQSSKATTPRGNKDEVVL